VLLAAGIGSTQAIDSGAAASRAIRNGSGRISDVMHEDIDIEEVAFPLHCRTSWSGRQYRGRGLQHHLCEHPGDGPAPVVGKFDYGTVVPCSGVVLRFTSTVTASTTTAQSQHSQHTVTAQSQHKVTAHRHSAETARTPTCGHSKHAGPAARMFVRAAAAAAAACGWMR